MKFFFNVWKVLKIMIILNIGCLCDFPDCFFVFWVYELKLVTT